MSATESPATIHRAPDMALRPSAAVDVVPDRPELTAATIRLWAAFSPLAPERRRWALTVGRVTNARAGDAFTASGEVAVVVSGCISTSVADTGLSAEILGPGAVLATGAARTLSGRWVTDGEIYRVSLARWIQAAGVEGAMHLVASVDQKCAGLERRIACATHHQATARIADLYLAIQETGAHRDILLSQEHVGAMLGMRRTTVNACSRQLEQSGASRSIRGRIRIMNRDFLAQTACGCRHIALAR